MGPYPPALPRTDRAMATEDDLLSRNAITAASVDDIAMLVNGREEVRPWERITSVGATIVRHGPGSIFVLAIVFDDVRTFVIGEIEPAWPQLVDLLHTRLPGVEAFTSWGPRLLKEPGVANLFERDS